MELLDGDMMVSVETYNYEKRQYDQSGVVHIKTGHGGGKKQALLIPLRRVLDQALELKKDAPLSRIEGWGER